MCPGDETDIYINDLPDVTDTLVSFYGDDTKICNGIESRIDLNVFKEMLAILNIGMMNGKSYITVINVTMFT